MKTLAEKIEVMQAALDGKEIELVRVVGMSGDNFHYTDTPMFDWASFDYRVKPEPMEFWVNVYDDFRPCLHETEDKAKTASDIGTRKTIKVREVIE